MNGDGIIVLAGAFSFPGNIYRSEPSRRPAALPAALCRSARVYRAQLPFGLITIAARVVKTKKEIELPLTKRLGNLGLAEALVYRVAIGFLL
ncbi:hypothetical protein [Mesorhizobium sp. WSM3866]|uniref:hypothetical protein n=1 Tax=Mesorhizobium sp. WSM3866 TaxID=422271 RepID=UPI0011410ADA|nr:hypothetical protein [Mesorhizobium sp. WSM3866]